MVLTPAAAPGDAPPGGMLVEVSGFGSNPTRLGMHLYVPTALAARPAVLVAVHNCTRSGPAFHEEHCREFAILADRYGFLIVYPTATRDGACFDVSSAAALRHGGGSDPVGIVSMVRHVQRRYGADPGRGFVIGLSSGAMMTNVLLGCYPDVFAAGAAFAGVPFGGFATTDGSGWNDDCASGRIVRTPRAWGDLVRGAHPGYRGRRPRVQLWHSTADDILRYPNLAEAVKQWTDVHGIDQAPARTDHPRPTWARTRYGTGDLTAPVEAVSVTGSPHNVLDDGMAAYTVAFFGLAPSP